MTSQSRRHDAANRQLRGWKEIASFLGKDESTVKRWATSRGLPIHRVPGQRRASVYAWTEEIQSWLTGRVDEPAPATVGEEAPSEPAAPPPAMGRSYALRQAIAALAVAVVALGFLSVTLVARQADTTALPVAYRPADAVNDLYLDGVYLYQKRTPETLGQAIAKLERAIALDPRFPEARTAAAIVYDLMVEYKLLGPEEGYGKAENAARAALQLDERQAGAHAVLGDLAFFWKQDYAAALAHFDRAIRLDPDDALGRHWYASALLGAGRYSEALREIEATQRLEPTSRSVLVSKGMILLAAGKIAAADEVLTRLTATEPAYRSPYRFLSFVALARNDYAAYLAALKTRFELTDDRAGQLVTLAGAKAYAEGGAEAMAKAMVSFARSNPEAATIEPYFLAHILSLSGDHAAAARQLGETKTRHAFYYSFDPAFAKAKADPAFMRQIADIGLPVVQ